LPFSKATVASKLNLSPETLSRLFAELSEQGVLTVKGRQLLLHRREALLPAE
jgi:CRP-like cAMP-binding protein